MLFPTLSFPLWSQSIKILMKLINNIFVLLLLVFVSHQTKAQWIQTQGPFTHWTGEIYMSGTTIYAGTSNGFYLSSNNGTSWTQMNTGLGNKWVHAILKVGNNLFCGTDDGIYLSTNGGVLWTNVQPGVMVTDLEVMGTNLFAGTQSGVYLSTNNGTTWNLSNTGLGNTYIYSMFADGTTIWAGTGLFPYKSTNNGATWTLQDNGLVPCSFGSFEVHDFEKIGTTLLLASNAGVFSTQNNGTSWNASSIGLPNTFACPVINELCRSGSKLYAGTFGHGIYVSTTNGANWGAANGNYLDAADGLITALAADSSQVLAGSDYYGGIRKTLNGGTTWTSQNIGLTNGSNIMAIGDAGSNLLACSYGDGPFLSSDGGSSWEIDTTGLNFINLNAYVFDGTNVFAGSSGGGIYKSTNNGVTWSPANNGVFATDIRSLYVTGSQLFAGSAYGDCYKSTNGGSTWTASAIGSSLQVQCFVQTGSTLIAGTSNGTYISTNGGTSFTSSSSGMGSVMVMGLATSGTTVLAATMNGIFSSTNGGVSWSSAMNGLPMGLQTFSIVSNGSTFYVATNDGVYTSTNNGGLWTAMNTGLGMNKYVNTLAISGAYLYAGIGDMGVWKYQIGTTSEVATVNGLPLTFYPNPCHNKLYIDLDANSSGLQLDILDALGRKLYSEKVTGQHSLLQTATWPNGTYYIQVEGSTRFGSIIVAHP